MRKILTLVIIITVLQISSQVNIVPNSGFEQYSSCPTYGAQWNLCTGWNNINMNLGIGLFGTPDYFNTCGTGNTAPPAIFSGTCSPQSGNAMMGVVLYNIPYPEYREYISTQLSCSMQPGTTYTLSFWLTNGSGVISPWTIKNIGVYFSGSPLTQTGYSVINVVPQCEITTNVASNVWTQYTFTVNPTSVWNYLSFGSFRDDLSNNPVLSFPNPGGAPSSYANYFVDEIKVLAPNTSVSLSGANGNSLVCFGKTATLTATGANSYTWSTTASGPTLAVSPTVTTTYSVSAANGCLTSTAAITITVAPLPTVTVTGPDLTLCKGQAAFLAAGGASNYTWSSGQLTSSISVSPGTTTTYSVTGTNTSGCSNTAAFTVSVSTCQGINVSLPGSPLNMYPNPVHDVLTIEFPGNLTGNKLNIINSIGETVYSFDKKDLPFETGTKKWMVDMSFLSKGLYFIQIQESGQTMLYKMIKE